VTIPTTWIRTVDNPLGDSASSGFSKGILSKIYVSARAHSHLLAFGEDVIGASLAHRGIVAIVAEARGQTKRAPLTDNQPSPWRISFSRTLHLRQSQGTKEEGMLQVTKMLQSQITPSACG
jgi:hypothetical protein